MDGMHFAAMALSYFSIEIMVGIKKTYGWRWEERDWILDRTEKRGEGQTFVGLLWLKGETRIYCMSGTQRTEKLSAGFRFFAVARAGRTHHHLPGDVRATPWQLRFFDFWNCGCCLSSVVVCLVVATQYSSSVLQYTALVQYNYFKRARIRSTVDSCSSWKEMEWNVWMNEWMYVSYSSCVYWQSFDKKRHNKWI